MAVALFLVGCDSEPIAASDGGTGGIDATVSTDGGRVTVRGATGNACFLPCCNGESCPGAMSCASVLGGMYCLPQRTSSSGGVVRGRHSSRLRRLARMSGIDWEHETRAWVVAGQGYGELTFTKTDELVRISISV